MVEEVPPARWFRQAALLGGAVAGESRRIIRAHLGSARREASGAAVVEIPFPDSLVLAAVLDIAAACFGLDARCPSAEAARQAVLRPLLRLAVRQAAPREFPEGMGMT